MIEHIFEIVLIVLLLIFVIVGLVFIINHAPKDIKLTDDKNISLFEGEKLNG